MRRPVRYNPTCNASPSTLSLHDDSSACNHLIADPCPVPCTRLVLVCCACWRRRHGARATHHRDRRWRRDDDPDRDRALRQRRHVPAEPDADRRRTISRAAACSSWSTRAASRRGRARRRRPLRRLDRARRRRGRRWQHDAAGRTAGSKSASSCSTSSSNRCSTGFTYVVAPTQLRATAHRIADVDLRKDDRRSPACSARASPTSPSKPRATNCSSPTPMDSIRSRSSASNEPLLSPVWSPDGTRIAYVSLENKKPVDLRAVAGYGRRGRWSPISAAATAHLRGLPTARGWRSR